MEILQIKTFFNNFAAPNISIYYKNEKGKNYVIDYCSFVKMYSNENQFFQNALKFHGVDKNSIFLYKMFFEKDRLQNNKINIELIKIVYKRLFGL